MAGDIPVATLRPNGAEVDTYYVHTDHLNTPRQVTRPADNAQVWTWFSDPFGTDAANGNPAAAGSFAYNLRFPGQIFKGPAGLHQNYFRNYDSATGRYIESDPIGLRGGINTYAYASGNALSRIDPYGLTSIEAEIAEAIASGDVETLESLLEGANPAQENLIRAAIQRLNSTADQIISKECQASIRAFPKSVLNNTLKEIKELAREGDRDAKTAWKLLNDLRFKKVAYVVRSKFAVQKYTNTNRTETNYMGRFCLCKQKSRLRLATKLSGLAKQKHRRMR